MEYLPLIISVTLIHLLAVMSPGPDLIMAIKNSLTYSRKTGIYTAIGFGGGIAVHILYCVLGLAFIISESIIVFTILKFLGAAYLIYIGVMSLLSKSSDLNIQESDKKTDISHFEAIKIGFLTNVLNPKATLFFLSLFTLVISPDTPNSIIGILSAIMIINTALWFMLVAVFFTQPKIRTVFNRFQGVFNKIFGGLLIALGLKVGLSG